MANEIIIFGAGGVGCEVAWLLESCSQAGKKYSVVCYIDDNLNLQGGLTMDIPVVSLKEAAERFPNARVVPAVACPQERREIIRRLETIGFHFETIIHPNVEMSKWVDIGEGAVICAGNILTTNIRIHRHVQINPACTIGHDSILGEFTTTAPGVHISGCVHLGKRVFVGAGAVIINGTQDKPLIIGDDAMIGAGATVISDVPDRATVVGVPARVVKIRNPD